MPQPNLKPKDLCGIPWRVAFALQADGWWLRQDIIWSKPNPMPESVTDRCTKAHEYLFLLTKAERYYFDQDAIAEPTKYPEGAWGRSKCYDDDKTGKLKSFYGNGAQWQGGETRNKRSVWGVATQPFSEAHFATFPPALIEPCILAGTGAKGCCGKCGAPWGRETERSKEVSDREPRGKALTSPRQDGNPWNENDGRGFNPTTTRTLGWSPSCACNAPVIPCTVLDPFGGAGTTGLVADRLQRDCIGIELNPRYVTVARKRIHGDAPLFASAAE